MSLRGMFSGDNGAINSTYRESVSTFDFISNLMKALSNRNKKLDVLMTKSGDSFGYDVILKCEDVTKYVQLKTTERTSNWKVYNSLIQNPDGEVIVIYITFPNDKTWDLSYRIWDKLKLPVIKTNAGKTTIKDSMLEPHRTIEMLAIYMFP